MSNKSGEQKRKFRNEWKYFLPEWEYEALKKRFDVVMEHDPNVKDGIYMIRSLYFDDYWNSAYEQKMAGVFARKKYRIRVYNCEDKVIKLERKLKNGNYIYKESASLTREETEKILDGDYEFLLKSGKSLCQEFYFECIANCLRPRVIVDYEREPYIMDMGEVRITFDSHVRAAAGNFDIFDPGLPSYEVLDPGRVILEVKFTEFLPKVVKDLLPSSNDEFSAISKYTLCYEKVNHLTDSFVGVSKSDRRYFG